MDTITADALDALLDILDQSGPKVLVIDKDIKGLISAIAPFSVLKAHGVEQVRWLASDLVELDVAAVVYLGASTPNCLSMVAQHAKKCLKARKSTLQLIVAGDSDPYVEWTLAENQVLGDIKLFEWPAFFASIGQNLSMFCDEEAEDELVSKTATAMTFLQRKYGTFGRISGFGASASRVHEVMLDKMGEFQAKDAETGGFHYHFGQAFSGATIDHMILIDRSVDWVTPLLIQLTYEGLIDEVFGIASPGIISTNNDNTKTKLGDDLFNSLSELNFGNVGAALNSSARNLQAELDQTHNAKTVAEIKDYVSQKLEGHAELKQNIKTHTTIAESLTAKVDTVLFRDTLSLQQDLISNELSTWDAVVQVQALIYQGCSVSDALRLACLICICRNGVREKYLHMLFNDILRTFGYHYLKTIIRLENLGLLFSNPPNNTPFTTLTKSFKLNSDQEALAEPYAGYVPLSTRIIQILLEGGDVRLAGENFSTVQKSSNAREAKLRRILLRNTPGHEHPNVLVMFIGGMTYSEATTIRMLEKSLPFNFIVAGTRMLGGKDVVDH